MDLSKQKIKHPLIHTLGELKNIIANTKEVFKDHIIFVDFGNFFQAFEEDAVILHKIFGWKYGKYHDMIRVGFPNNKNSTQKVINDLYKLEVMIVFLYQNNDGFIEKRHYTKTKYRQTTLDLIIGEKELETVKSQFIRDKRNEKDLKIKELQGNSEQFLYKEKINEAIYLLYNRISHFPVNKRLLISQPITKHVDRIISNLNKLNNWIFKECNATSLKEISHGIDCIEQYLEIAYNLNCMSLKNKATLLKSLSECGSMTGSIIKNLQQDIK